MVVNYSKWDALEVSDDSDIEVHPNVDKRSFIRAKQNQIHQERAQRKHEIITLRYERIINDALLTRIDALLTALKTHASNASNDEDPDRIVFQSIMESAGDSAQDNPPPRPEGVHAQVEEQPTYSKMMASLVDQVKKEVDATAPTNRLQGYIKEINVHKDKVLGLQQQLLERLAQLEKEEGSKITSENIRTGFDSSHVSKSTPAAASRPAAGAATTTTTPELLNPPSRPSAGPTLTRNDSADSGAEADIEDAATPSSPSDPERIRASALGKQFGKISAKDYGASLNFLSQHPSVLAERETDGLLIQAWETETAGKHELARQLVHQALLIKYCVSLSGGGGGGSRNGVGLFFKRVTTPGHEARTLFLSDVNETYQRLKERSAAIAAEEAAEEAAAGGAGDEVEQIQLHAVNPNQTILIQTPDASSDAAARSAFDAFPPGLQRALESGELEQVNKVLGKMSVSEAEEVVGQLGQHGMLSMEEGIIDATTDEGRRQMEHIEKTGRFPGTTTTTTTNDDRDDDGDGGGGGGAAAAVEELDAQHEVDEDDEAALAQIDDNDDHK